MFPRAVPVGQHLPEEDVVVGPDGEEVLSIVVLGVHIEAFVGNGRDGSGCIAEVAVGKAVLDVHGDLVAQVARRALLGMAAIVCHGLELELVVLAYGVILVALVLGARSDLLVAVALVEVEAVEVVGHLAVIEGTLGLRRCHAAFSRFRIVELVLLIVAVDYLNG